LAETERSHGRIHQLESKDRPISKLAAKTYRLTRRGVALVATPNFDRNGHGEYFNRACFPMRQVESYEVKGDLYFNYDSFNTPAHPFDQWWLVEHQVCTVRGGSVTTADSGRKH